MDVPDMCKPSSVSVCPETPEEIIGWLAEPVAGWNQAPTPFVWGGRRRARRERARQRRSGMTH